VITGEKKGGQAVRQSEVQGHDFVNQLVGVLTWGIYTPMTISVTCDAG
jgi:hypothetical protein